MAVLTASELSMRYGQFDIFQNISIAIHHGERAAIIGPNGQGKTTLLRILASTEKPTEGQVFTAKGLKIGYLRQEAAIISTEGTLLQLANRAFAHLKAMSAELAAVERALTDDDSLLQKYGRLQQEFELAGGYTYELTIEQVLTGLGFSRDEFEQPLSQFSGGQLSRAQLAQLLLEKPQLLLLDEPTNHLDLSAIEWLENYLSAWNGAVLLVSHDRYFLDKVVNRVFELQFSNLERYRGNYSHYLQQRAERWTRREKEYKAQQAFIAKEEDFIQRHLAGQRTREAQGRRKRLNRLKETGLVEKGLQQKTMGLSLKTDLRSGDLVMATHDLSLGYPDGDVLATVSDVEIRRGQTVALLGPNGSGKTTFVKTILRQLKPKAGDIRLGAAVETGYFAQIRTELTPKNSVLDEVLQVSDNMLTADARNHLGRFLFSGDDVFKQVADLSGGERNRLALAKLAMSGANFLILDEPTNHLDIQAQEILEAVLSDFDGTILLVSHDRYFVDSLATQVWMLEEVGLTALDGNYSDYLAYKESLRAEKVTREEEKAGKQAHRQSKAVKRAEEKRRRAVADLEEAIEAAETKLTQLTAEMEVASANQNIVQLQSLSEEYQRTEETLAELFNNWISMEAV